MSKDTTQYYKTSPRLSMGPCGAIYKAIPEQSEAQIERDVLELLNLHGLAWRTHGPWHRPESAGIPDVIGVIQGRLVALEIKRLGGKTTPNQDEFMAKLRGNGAIAEVVNSVDDALDVLNRHFGR